MLAGPRFALSEFLVFTHTKLENTDIQISDFPKVGQHKEVCVRHLQSPSFQVSPMLKSKTLTKIELGPYFKQVREV